ncbi:hypothetical protein NSU_3535 [Novosphingobium pentaromativorans US6-1]|uniref:HTH araC/xylS-type domain-containing protein n=2 Tax=Novosphingobium pentaromativorans TaxID=205844 RepID=G6EGR4_9SPHN|nr:hypothetical protein NSU_3535 [Novosphingobium pentaromativorans US6-1]
MKNARAAPGDDASIEEIRPGMARIAILVLEGCLISSIAVLKDIVTLLRNLVDERLAHESWVIEMDIPRLRDPMVARHLSLGGTSKRAFDGTMIEVDGPLSGDESYDFIFIPSMPWDRALAIAESDLQRIGTFLRTQHEGGAVVAAQGGGVVPVAASGLLDRHAAAVFWSRAVAFRERFPAVRPEAVETITFQNNVGCASTMAAGPPLICRILDRFMPAFVATALRQQVLGEDPPHTDDEMGNWEPEDLVVSRARLWLAQNYHAQFRLADLAALVGVSERSLSRHFNATIGMTPHDYQRGLRMDAAARLLRNTPMRVDQVAQRVGYKDSRFFARAFRDWFGMTPKIYRVRNRTRAGRAAAK